MHNSFWGIKTWVRMLWAVESGLTMESRLVLNYLHSASCRIFTRVMTIICALLSHSSLNEARADAVGNPTGSNGNPDSPFHNPAFLCSGI